MALMLTFLLACAGLPARAQNPPGRGAATGPATYHLQVIFATYQENRTHNWPDIQATAKAQILDPVSRTFALASYGRLSFDMKVYPTYFDTSVSMINGCNFPVQQVEAAFGQIPADTFRVVVMPAGTPCNSTDSGTLIWGVGIGPIDHEVGHALGLGHQASYTCNTPTSCIREEYGQMDFMGQGAGAGLIDRSALNAFGWSPRFTAPRITTSQTVTLTAGDMMTPGIKGAFAVPTNVLNTVGIDFRKNATGVMLYGPPGSALYDLDRQTSAHKFTLNVGETFCPSPDVCVTTTAVRAETATVKIALNEDTSRQPAPR